MPKNVSNFLKFQRISPEYYFLGRREKIHPKIFQKIFHKNERGHVKKIKNENFGIFFSEIIRICWTCLINFQRISPKYYSLGWREKIHPKIFQKYFHKNERGHVKKIKNKSKILATFLFFLFTYGRSVILYIFYTKSR